MYKNGSSLIVLEKWSTTRQTRKTKPQFVKNVQSSVYHSRPPQEWVSAAHGTAAGRTSVCHAEKKVGAVVTVCKFSGLAAATGGPDEMEKSTASALKVVAMEAGTGGSDGMLNAH